MTNLVHRFALCRNLMHEASAARTREASPDDVAVAVRAPIYSPGDRPSGLVWLSHIRHALGRAHGAGASVPKQVGLGVAGVATLLSTYTLVPFVVDAVVYNRRRKTGCLYRKRSTEGVRENMVADKLDLLNHEVAGILYTVRQSLERKYLTSDELQALGRELQTCARDTRTWVAGQKSSRLRGSIILSQQLGLLDRSSACLLSVTTGCRPKPQRSETTRMPMQHLTSSC